MSEFRSEILEFDDGEGRMVQSYFEVEKINPALILGPVPKWTVFHVIFDLPEFAPSGKCVTPVWGSDNHADCVAKARWFAEGNQ